ncbi:MAG: hypothetical protein HOV80_02160 [Polyangiaceae bacterium]|nr:hypothetical protein [Polyangiaceae bacterium]
MPFGGETPSGGVKVSGSAWVYWPDDNGVSRYNVKESTDTKTTLFAFGSQDETFSVPTAFVRPVSPPNGLAKGDIVWTTVVQGLECALVREAKEEKAKVDLYWAGKRETRDVALGELLHPTGKAEFGAPVLFKKGDAWVGGVLVHADKKTAWIAPGASFGTDEVKVDVASIRPMDVNKRRKKGDKVIACPSDCVAGKILAAKDQGLTYEVQDGDDGPVMDVSACAISSIPK